MWTSLVTSVQRRRIEEDDREGRANFLVANKFAYLGEHRRVSYQISNKSNFFRFQKISERAFDGLNNLQRLNLENNRLKSLERGIFTGVPALIYLNLMKNSLGTITYNNILPLMDNLVNNTNSILDLTGTRSNYRIYERSTVIFMASFLLMRHNHRDHLIAWAP